MYKRNAKAFTKALVIKTRKVITTTFQVSQNIFFFSYKLALHLSESTYGYLRDLDTTLEVTSATNLKNTF